MSSSWDSYIDNLIERSRDQSGTAHVDRACIINIDGGGLWTTHRHPNALKLQGREGVNIAHCFKSKDFSAFMAGGVYVEDGYYIFLREDGNVIYARTSSLGCVTAHASKTAIIVAHCPTDCQHGIMNNAVAKLVEYLESHDM